MPFLLCVFKTKYMYFRPFNDKRGQLLHKGRYYVLCCLIENVNLTNNYLFKTYITSFLLVYEYIFKVHFGVYIYDIVFFQTLTTVSMSRCMPRGGSIFHRCNITWPIFYVRQCCVKTKE